MKYRRALLGDDWVEMKIPMSRSLRDKLKIEARRENRSVNSIMNERLTAYFFPGSMSQNQTLTNDRT